MIAAGGIGAGWSGEPTGRRNVLGGLIWPRQAAVMGSGMSEEEEEEGVDATQTLEHIGASASQRMANQLRLMMPIFLP